MGDQNKNVSQHFHHVSHLIVRIFYTSIQSHSNSDK